VKERGNTPQGSRTLSPATDSQAILDTIFGGHYDVAENACVQQHFHLSRYALGSDGGVFTCRMTLAKVLARMLALQNIPRNSSRSRVLTGFSLRNGK
jgi:hypothetical protein